VEEQQLRMQVQDYTSPHTRTPESKKPDESLSEDEGSVNKQILLSIGSMA
jgi:hypothetical protein